MTHRTISQHLTNLRRIEEIEQRSVELRKKLLDIQLGDHASLCANPYISSHIRKECAHFQRFLETDKELCTKAVNELESFCEVARQSALGLALLPVMDYQRAVRQLNSLAFGHVYDTLADEKCVMSKGETGPRVVVYQRSNACLLPFQALTVEPSVACSAIEIPRFLCTKEHASIDSDIAHFLEEVTLGPLALAARVRSAIVQQVSACTSGLRKEIERCSLQAQASIGQELTRLQETLCVLRAMDDPTPGSLQEALRASELRSELVRLEEELVRMQTRRDEDWASEYFRAHPTFERFSSSTLELYGKQLQHLREFILKKQDLLDRMDGMGNQELEEAIKEYNTSCDPLSEHVLLEKGLTGHTRFGEDRFLTLLPDTYRPLLTDVVRKRECAEPRRYRKELTWAFKKCDTSCETASFLRMVGPDQHVLYRSTRADGLGNYVVYDMKNMERYCMSPQGVLYGYYESGL